MTNIKIIWATAARHAEEVGKDPVVVRDFEFFVPDGTDDIDVCEKAFRDTNIYEGEMWDAMQPLPENRTHTALSVGDYVEVDGRLYRCAAFGWKATDEFEPGLDFFDKKEEASA